MNFLAKSEIAWALIKFIIMIAAFFKFVNYIHMCNLDQLHRTCHKYHNGALNGSMCAMLCSEDFIANQCLSANKDKTVFKINHRNKTFIMKFGNIRTTSTEWRFLSKFKHSSWLVKLYGSCGRIYVVKPVEDIAGMIYGTSDDIDDMLGMPDIFDQISTYDFPKFPTIIRAFLNMGSRWKVKLEELLYASLYQRYNPSFKERVFFVKNTILMLRDMTISTNGEVMLCDIHLDNLGITENKSVQLIDADHVFSLTEIADSLSKRECSSDKDCKIGDDSDCMSSCDLSIQRCTSKVPLTNLKNFCGIFSSTVLESIPTEFLNCTKPLLKLINSYETSASKSVGEELKRMQLILRTIHELSINCL